MRSPSSLFLHPSPSITLPSVLFPLPSVPFPISGTLTHPSGFVSIITSSVKPSQTSISQTESGILKSVHSERCPLGLCHIAQLSLCMFVFVISCDYLKGQDHPCVAGWARSRLSEPLTRLPLCLLQVAFIFLKNYFF